MGNAHAKRAAGEEHDGATHMMASPMTPGPGSPLTYVPQMPMEPILPKTPELGTQQPDYAAVAAWPAQPKLVPVVFVWSHGGAHVEVEGSFDNWTQRHRLQPSGKDFSIVRLLPPGVYQYKFIVDGEWKYDPNQKAMYDEMGNVNNVIEVQEYVPENLDGISGFDPPPSPPSSYSCPPPAQEDYAKEPAAMPPHLQLTLLNVAPSMVEAQAALPRPAHVVLNHLYLQRGAAVNALVVGTTHRYKSKYVTAVLYKPRPRAAAAAAGSPE